MRSSVNVRSGEKLGFVKRGIGRGEQVISPSKIIKNFNEAVSRERRGNPRKERRRGITRGRARGGFLTRPQKKR